MSRDPRLIFGFTFDSDSENDFQDEYYNSSLYFKSISDSHLNNAIYQAEKRIDWWNNKLTKLIKEYNDRNKPRVVKVKITKKRNIKTGQRKK